MNPLQTFLKRLQPKDINKPFFEQGGASTPISTPAPSSTTGATSPTPTDVSSTALRPGQFGSAPPITSTQSNLPPSGQQFATNQANVFDPNNPPAPIQAQPIAGGTQGVPPPVKQPSAIDTQRQAFIEASKRFQDTLKQGEEEKFAREKLADFITSTKGTLQGTQDQPIPLGLIRGQQESILGKAQITEEGLQRDVSLAQQARLGEQAAAEVNLELQEALLEDVREGTEDQNRQLTIEELNALGGNLPFGTTVGEAIQAGVQPKAEAEEAKGFTLSPGQQRFDAEGNVIASGGPKALSESAIKKALEKTEQDAQARSTQASTIGAITNVLNDPNLGRVSGSGPGRFLSGAGFTGTAGVRSQLAQIKALTSLEGRSKLKGSGTISDFEAGMLSDSANALNFAIQEDGQVSMPDDQVVQNLKNIRGTLMLKAGQSVSVTVTDPSTGESISTELNSKDAQDLWLDGNIIDFQ